YLGVPLYLLLGGRKLKKLAAKKHNLTVSDRSKQHPIKDTLTPPIYAQYGTSTRAPISGNSTEFHPSGEKAYEVLISQIREAKESIDILTFILAKDSVGLSVIAALTEKAKEGVKVRLLLDALGCFRLRNNVFNEFKKAGGQVERFMPTFPIQSRWSANLRNHRKIAIFDQKRAIFGGRNIAFEYMGPTPHADRWTDFSALLKGPVVSNLLEIFTEDWAYASGKPSDSSLQDNSRVEDIPKEGNSDIQIVASGPDVVGDPLYESIVSMIQEADKQIWIVTPYYIPDEVLQRTLMIKARAGREIKLIVPRRSTHPITDFARTHYLRELTSAGVQVLLYTPRMLHGKAIIVDQTVAMTGSANLDLRSLFVNYEIGTFFYSKPDLENIHTWMEDILKETIPFEESVKKNPSFLHNIAEDVSRLLAPLL
ncbi:MAG: cardiolipin synthase, partial [Opitutaceae bacterium]|nr:cardiolipin synthase [Opitutaceae bacterium]